MYGRRDPEARRKYEREWAAKRRDRIKQLKNDMKTSCIVCGETEKCCLDFHHTRDKDFKIGDGSNVGSKTEQAFMEEIQKCIILCANCHRKLHADVIKLPEGAGA